MVILGFLASVSAATVPVSPTAARIQSRVSVRIVNGARVEQGRTEEPHSAGRTVITERNGERREIRLVEFH